MAPDSPPPPPDRETRRSAIADELTARLAPVCEGWPPELFDSMVQKLTDISLRYDAGTTSTYDRRTTERLVDEMQKALERSRDARKDGAVQDP